MRGVLNFECTVVERWFCFVRCCTVAVIDVDRYQSSRWVL